MRRRKVLCFLTVAPCLPLLVASLYWLLTVRAKNTVSYTFSEDIQRRRRENETLMVMHKFNAAVAVQSEQTTMATMSVNKELLALSEHPNIDIRGKFQKQHMNELCRRYFFSGEQHLPKEESRLSSFHRHLMFDDRQKVIFCFVPKIGCTNMKRLMLYMGGYLPLKTIDWPWVEDSIYLEPALQHASFLNTSFSDRDRMWRLRTYYKFMIVRNPLERIVSAFRNKVEHPMIFHPPKSKIFANTIKREILMRYRPAELLYWERTASHNLFNISVSFQEFVRYLVETDKEDMNEHLQPSMDICHPCIVKYDFYGNFKNYSSDARQLIEKFKTNPKFYRDESLHAAPDQTSKKIAHYYKTLSYRDKLQLFGAWYDELLFYYTLYPAESDSHKKLLGINEPVI